MNGFGAPWFYWAIGGAVGFPVGLITLTEWHRALIRRQSVLARPVYLLRNYLLPIGALLVLLVGATQVPFRDTPSRVVATLFSLALLALLLSGLNATLFKGAPEGSWRRRIPEIFLDVARFVLIAVGLALILSYIWGAHVGALFTALGVTSVVVGLMVQDSVGQVVSGLFMLFEQPFGMGDWLYTPEGRGRVVGVNWRAVHIETDRGLQVVPNSVLAGTSFTNCSKSADGHKLAVTATFSAADPPDRVCAMLSRIAAGLPQLKTGVRPDSVALGAGGYRTMITLTSAADGDAAQAAFQRWVWYAARREGLHLDGLEDDFSTAERVEEALRTVVASELRLSPDERAALVAHARMVRYGADEIVQRAGEVSAGMTFVVAGRIRLTARTADGSSTPLSTFEGGAFLGLTALTRQPNLADAYALEEVTAVEIDREHLEGIVRGKPALLRDFGRVIEERRGMVLLALAAGGVPAPH